MTRRLVVVNTGASTLKLAAVEVDDGRVRELRHVEQDREPEVEPDAALRMGLEALGVVPDAFGHRVVHGGVDFVEPVTLSTRIEAELEALVPLAPLHNGPALAVIRELRKLYPDLPSVAVFDTAFHARRPEVSRRYALPSSIIDQFDIRRFGFHGLAHASLMDELAQMQDLPVDKVSAVTLQLGAGCSACAIRRGCSIETTMGYTPLEGLVMATRSGDIDPAIVLRLMQAGFEANRIENELTRRSGLLALCGLSDMRAILAAEAGDDTDARFALELFCHRIVLSVGAYFTLLNGEGALVFGGGIGTNSPEIRERVCQGLGAWDVVLDHERNALNEPGRISTRDSRAVFALQTNESAVIARAVDRHLSAHG
jgi:acetate kinase